MSDGLREMDDTTPVEVEAPEGESREQAFQRLMALRVTGARRYLRLVGNMSNRDSYRYSPEQVRQAFDAIEEALDHARMRFNAAGPAQRDMFKY